MQGADVPVCLTIAVDGGECSMFPWVFQIRSETRKQKKHGKKRHKNTESNATKTEIRNLLADVEATLPWWLQEMFFWDVFITKPV